MAEVLELAQLLEHDGMAEVDVGRGRVDTQLDPKRPPLLLGCSSWPPEPRSGSAAWALRASHAAASEADRAIRANARVSGSACRAASSCARLSMPGRTRGIPPMSDADITPLPSTRRARRRAKKAGKPRLRKLRLIAVFIPLAFIALISTVFGMMMAVGPEVEMFSAANQARHARNSVLYDDQGKVIGIITTGDRILLQYDQISPWVIDAVTGIEDKRFFSTRASTCAASAARSSPT